LNYKGISNKLLTFAEILDTMSKGRDKSLIEKRNDKLLRRYWVLTERERLRFDDALKILSQEEFFLSEERIMCIIRDHGHRAKE